MNLWFNAATEYFELFLEEKFNVFGESCLHLNSAPQLDRLQTLPQTFLDDVHQRVLTCFHELPDGFDSVRCATSETRDFLYGELSSIGVRQLLHHVHSPTTTNEVEGDFNRSTMRVLVDLGSGTGRALC